MPARSRPQIEQDRALIAEYHLKGWTQKAIAEKVGVTTTIVKYDLNAIEADWRASAAFDFDLSKQRNLADIALLEREAWAAWEGSKAPREKTRTRTARRNGAAETLEATVSSAEKVSEQRDPDPRYMVVIQWCIAERNKILGHYAPVGVNVHHGGAVRQIAEIVYELPPAEPTTGLTIIGGPANQPALAAAAVVEEESSEYDLAT